MKRLGVLILSLTTFLWGTTFVVTKTSLVHFPADALVLGRFLVAGVVFLPFLRMGRRLWLAATELGVLLWLGFGMQTIGLKYTTASRSAFITSMHVIFVPAFAGMLGRSSRPAIWVAAAMALTGVGLLSHDGSPPNLGDWWTLASAIIWGIYITRLETITAELPSLPLTAAHLWVVVFLSAGWVCMDHQPIGPMPWAAVIYLGLAATALTTWFQTLGQKWVSAPQAAVLYTLEPVWGSLFAWIYLGERFGTSGWIGGVLILLAALMTQIPPRKTLQSSEMPSAAQS
jgi:drug/metabolite transporter (DMT)-like permease